MRPADLERVTVRESADRYLDLVRARTVTGALSPATAEVYSRDVATFAELAGPGLVLDDLTGADVDAVLLAFARKPDGRRVRPGVGGRARRRSRGSGGRCRRSSSTRCWRGGCRSIR